jgi:hypothetical protein
MLPVVDLSNKISHTGQMPDQPPWCPPLVEGPERIIGHLLCWEYLEISGYWCAWISWVQTTSTRHIHKVVCVQARSIKPIEEPDAYAQVPRRIRYRDGTIRPLPHARK